MNEVWVYKFDGTIQCDTASVAAPLEQTRRELAILVGSKNILAEKKASRMMIQQCGLPTGAINAFQLSAEGWKLLHDGISGMKGFFELSGDIEGDDFTGQSVGKLIGSLTGNNPTAIRQLIGHSLRVYTTGDALTMDWRPDRFNIEVSSARDIVGVWFG